MRFTRVMRPEPATTMASPEWRAAAGDRAGVAAEVEVGPVDPLHRQTERRCGAMVLDVDALEVGNSAGPSCQGVRGLADETLSPKRADIGMAATERKSSGSAKTLKASTMSSKRASLKSTRSILLTASTTWRMPSSETISECRRVCGNSPLRASTSRMARSALEAPVAMLRVYCSCPGVSATMNERFRWRNSDRRRRW